MLACSDRFLASLRQAHLIASSCQLWFPGEASPVEVGVEAGSVTIDATAQARRRGSVQIPWSLSAGIELGLDLRSLALGGYATLRHGLRYPTGERELLTLGHLRVESVSWETLAQSASLELADRMAQVRDEPFTAPFAAGGLRPAAAAVQIVQGVFGASIGYSTPHDPAITLADVWYSESRAEALTALEQAASAQSYFDAEGDFVFASAEPGPPVWAVDAGEEGVMIDAGEDLDRTGVYNGVLVTGQSTADSAPISALAVEDDPELPTRWGGPFGKVVLVAQSSSVQDAAQALAAAESLLRLRLKATRRLKLAAAPCPALEAGDTIDVLFPDGREERHQIDAVTVDMAGGAQTIDTRSNFDPEASELLAPVSLRFYSGAAAWRQLEDARGH
jgi:hypothetical protein